MKQVILIVSLLLSSIATGAIRAQSLAGVPTARIDSLFKDRNTTQSPGAVLAIVKDGQTVFKQA
ncbi:hypothetical protein [Telluribacter humicola]|uniref:hypothetical protein n=1 Tax=Telluribacter humicola TaxID=1720261 RepID=UPI001A96AE13|nr:hypothetical protein [Telluribacter humicola]